MIVEIDTNSKLLNFQKRSVLSKVILLVLTLFMPSEDLFRKTNDVIISDAFYYPNWHLGFMELSTN